MKKCMALFLMLMMIFALAACGEKSEEGSQAQGSAPTEASNILSDETIESPKAKALYIVYKEGPTGDDCDMTSEENSQVMLEVADRDERYMSRVDLDPGESTGGWMIYQRQSDKNEVTMHYYSKFINVPPDLVFGFTAE